MQFCNSNFILFSIDTQLVNYTVHSTPTIGHIHVYTDTAVTESDSLVTR